MRAVAILATLLAATSVALLSITLTQVELNSETNSNTYYSDVVSTRDKSLLKKFLRSLDPAIMKECVAQHDSGRPIDLDYLATCGDFDAYAKYMRLSKFEAVKKFEHVLLHSSSKLEFEDRLAR